MKKIISLIAFLPIAIFSQVGINTTTPTNTLDVNGSLRVRNLQNGTVESLQNGELTFSPYVAIAMGVVDKNGNLLKGFGATSTRINSTTYRITFLAPQPDNDYIIYLTARGGNRDINYDTTTTNSFIVSVDATTGNFDFNFLIFKTNY